MRTDGEPAIKAPQDLVARDEKIKDTVIPEVAARYDWKSHGIVENTNKRIANKVRTVRHRFESMTGMRLAVSSPIARGIPKWSAQLLNRYTVGAGGQSPHRRLKGRDYAGNIIEVDEICWVRDPVAKATFDDRWTGHILRQNGGLRGILGAHAHRCR